MNIRFVILIFIILGVSIPAHAERYSSGGEALFVGALQGLLIMFVIWIWRSIKGRKSQTKEDPAPPCKTNEKTDNKILSPWEQYKQSNPGIAKSIESLNLSNLSSLTNKDIQEIVETFIRMSKVMNCDIASLKEVCIIKFKSQFNSSELKEVLNKLALKEIEESKNYSISSHNTMSYFIKIWLKEYIQQNED